MFSPHSVITCHEREIRTVSTKNENSIMLPFSQFFVLGYTIYSLFLSLSVYFFSFKVEKEPGFGNFRFNQSLLEDHVPSMFENGDRHRQLKSFLIAISQNMLRMGRLIPNVMDIIPEHLIKWNFKEGKFIILQFFSQADERRSTPCIRDAAKLFRGKINE